MSLRRNEQKADRLDLFKDDVVVVVVYGSATVRESLERKKKNFQN